MAAKRERKRSQSMKSEAFQRKTGGGIKELAYELDGKRSIRAGSER